MSSCTQPERKEERNGNISHTSINILWYFPCKSGSCGRRPDNVTGMRAAFNIYRATRLRTTAAKAVQRFWLQTECVLFSLQRHLNSSVGCSKVQTAATLSTCIQLCRSTLLTVQKTTFNSKPNSLRRKFFFPQLVANV